MRFPVRPLVAALIAVAAQICSANPSTMGGYDFAYAVTAEPVVRPIQVFDDGAYTFFHFANLTTWPAIFKVTAEGNKLVRLTKDGQFLRAEGVAQEYLIMLGEASGRVVYSKRGRFQNGPTAPGYLPPRIGEDGRPMSRAQEAAYETSLTANSYATPAKGDRVVWTTGKIDIDEVAVAFKTGSSDLSAEAKKRLMRTMSVIGGAYSIKIVGRDDDTYQEGVDRARAQAIRSFLITNGARPELISAETGAAHKDGSHWLSHVTVQSHRISK